MERSIQIFIALDTSNTKIGWLMQFIMLLLVNISACCSKVFRDLTTGDNMLSNL